MLDIKGRNHILESRPNVIFSSFARSGASAVDAILGPLLTSIGYYVTPFGIEGSSTICEEVAGVHEPFYHWTHAAPNMFEPLLERSEYRFLYQYRDPRDSVISWAYNEITEGNIKGTVEVDDVLKHIIMSRFHLADHIARAREWLSLGEKVCCLSFEEMIADKIKIIRKVIKFLNVGNLMEDQAVKEAVVKFESDQHKRLIKSRESRLSVINLERGERGIAGGWVKGLSPVNKLLLKKVAGDFLIELGYERNFDW